MLDFRRIMAASVGIAALSMSAGCASPPIDKSLLATMEPKQLIFTLARDRPIQIAFRDNVVKSVEQIRTRDFIAYQAYYVAHGAGEDEPAYKQIDAYCAARGGIFPDTSFGQPNPRNFGSVSILNVLGSKRSPVPSTRSDCLSLSSGRLLFSTYRSVSAQFTGPMSTTTQMNYNIVSIVSPTGAADSDPSTQFKFGRRDFTHNYFSYKPGTFSAQGLLIE